MLGKRKRLQIGFFHVTVQSKIMEWLLINRIFARTLILEQTSRVACLTILHPAELRNSNQVTNQDILRPNGKETRMWVFDKSVRVKPYFFYSFSDLSPTSALRIAVLRIGHVSWCTRFTRRALATSHKNDTHRTG